MELRVLLKFGQFDAIPLLLYLLRLSLSDWVAVVEAVLVLFEVDAVAALGLGLAVEVHLQETALHLFSVHLDQSLLRRLVRLVLDVGKAFGLFGLPVVGDADSFDFAEASEPVTDVVFFEVVWQAFDKQSVALGGHRICHLCGHTKETDQRVIAIKHLHTYLGSMMALLSSCLGTPGCQDNGILSSVLFLQALPHMMPSL